MNGRFRLAVAVAALAIAAGARGAATPAFSTAEPLQFHVAPAVTFYVFATGGEIKDVHVFLKELKDPAGRDVAVGAEVKPSTIAAVGTSGSPITLTLPVGSLMTAGDSHATIVFTGTATVDGKAQEVSLVRTVTITRPKPDITAPGLKDVAVKVERSCPFGDAEATVEVRIVNGGTAAIGGVGIRGGVVNADGDPNQLVPGRVRVTPLGGAAEPAAGFYLRPDATMLALHLSELRHAGVFRSRLHVRPLPGINDEIPFRIVVTDTVWWPLLAIAVGVALGFLANFLTSKWRPTEEAKLVALRLRQSLVRLGTTTADRQTLDAIDELDAQILEAETTAIVDPVAARQRLETLTTQVDALRNSAHATMNAALQDYGAVSASLEALAGRPDLTPEQKEQMVELARAKAAIDDRRYLDAAAILAPLKTAVGVVTVTQSVRGFDDWTGGESGTRVLVRQIVVDAPPVAGRAVRLTLIDPDAGADSFTWTFGDGTPAQSSTASVVTHTFRRAGAVKVVATMLAGGTAIDTVKAPLIVGESPIASEVQSVAWSIFGTDLLLSGIALLISVVTGLLALWANKTFGTAANYLEAIIWGVGVDASVRGFSAVLKKISG